MSIIEVLDGRLYQWDTGRRVAIHPLAGQTADEVHFSNNGKDALVVKPALEGGVLVAHIPNILLQDTKNVIAYAVMVSTTGERTTYGRSLFISPRAKPADYVYTETELADYKKLEARVEALEKGGGGGGVTQETDPTVPAWAKTPEKPSYTAAEVGALPDTYTPPVDAALSETSTNPVQNKIVSAKISEVEAIAKGRATGYVFETEADMQSWIAAHADALNVGDNLYIRATDVPDYWWDGTDAKPLETQKVDLTEYAKKSEVPAVDTTLTKSGQAADAAAVGEQLSSLSSKIEEIPGGKNGITPTIGDNGNWYLGDTDTGKPSRGEPGQDGADGKDGAPGADGADGHTPVKGTDYFTEADKQEIAEAAAGMVSIPDKLPNPNTLTFTGAVTGSYDGSESVTVEIPSGGGSSGGGSGFQRIIDFTTEEGVTQFSTPALTQEQGDAISAASVMNIVLYVPIDSNDTETSTQGTVNINFYIGWNSDIVRNFKAIPAPTETYQAYGVWNFQVFKHPKSYAYLSSNDEPILVIAYGRFKNTTHIVPVLSSTIDTLKWAKSGYYFTVTGSQNMAAGTRFIVEVGI